MTLTIAQIGIGLFGSTAFLLVLSESKAKQKAGVVFGLISNPFWWAMVVVTQQWYTIPVHLLYTYGWLSKAWRLFRPDFKVPNDDCIFCETHVQDGYWLPDEKRMLHIDCREPWESFTRNDDSKIGG